MVAVKATIARFASWKNLSRTKRLPAKVPVSEISAVGAELQIRHVPASVDIG
jgi:hypothetical protein